jgi:hypothetical protein
MYFRRRRYVQSPLLDILIEEEAYGNFKTKFYNLVRPCHSSTFEIFSEILRPKGTLFFYLPHFGELWCVLRTRRSCVMLFSSFCYWICWQFCFAFCFSGFDLKVYRLTDKMQALIVDDEYKKVCLLNTAKSFYTVLFCQLFWVFRLISSSNIWVFVSLSYCLSFYGFSCGSFEQFNENFYLWFNLLNIRLGLGFFGCGPPLKFFALLQ